MGDCRLHVQYAGSLAAELSVPDSLSDETSSHSCSKSDNGSSSCWFVSSPSADTTLRQYADSVLSNLRHRLHRLHGRSESNTTTGNSRVPVPPSFESGTPSSLLLYDMTLHPPRNATPTILSCSALTGPNSRTLNQMGWFPSARLVVCYERDIGRRGNDTDAAQCITDIVGEGAGDEETGEYNRIKRLAVDDHARMVKLTGADNDESAGDGYRPKVSEMMAAVTNRDVGDGLVPVIDEDSAAAERARKAAEKRKKEARRTARLDEAIRRIDEGNEKSSSKRSKTNGNISAQVKKMLVKSRAVGKKSLREEDRFYVEIFFVDDTVPDRTGAVGEAKGQDIVGESSSSYQFFSRLAKVGSVASNSIASSVGSDAASSAEVLVKTTKAKDNATEYRRLPNLMALHEAEEQGYLQQFDRVVVRKYRLCSTDADDDGSGPTKSVLDVGEEEVGCSAGSSGQHEAATFGTSDDKKGSSSDDDHTTNEHKGTAAACTGNYAADSSTAATLSLYQNISQAIEATSTKGGNVKKKKKSSTSEKVRQMLIKGKAKGDKKVVKEHDRYYLEAILITEDGVTGSITANKPPAPYFFNRMSSIEDSILRVLGISSNDSDSVELYVRESRDGQGDTFGRLEDVTMRLCDAEKTSALQQFSCVVVKQITSSTA